MTTKSHHAAWFNGQTALITGGALGVGQATALSLKG